MIAARFLIGIVGVRAGREFGNGVPKGIRRRRRRRRRRGGGRREGGRRRKEIKPFEIDWNTIYLVMWSSLHWIKYSVAIKQ